MHTALALVCSKCDALLWDALYATLGSQTGALPAICGIQFRCAKLLVMLLYTKEIAKRFV
jgi:hypothetical protein